MKLLEEKINSLWGAMIKEYFYDITNSRLEFSLDLLDKGVHSSHSIIIEGITSLCIQNEIDSKGHILLNFLELTSIALIHNQAIGENMSCGKRCAPNIAIEISDAYICIAAKDIIVDGIKLSLEDI